VIIKSQGAAAAVHGGGKKVSAEKHQRYPVSHSSAFSEKVSNFSPLVN
jgi:hypothetical protein